MNEFERWKEENENEDLQIPDHCDGEGGEIFEGFGWKELYQSIPIIVACIFIGAIFQYFVVHNVIAIVTGIILGAFLGYSLTKKDRYSRESVLDLLKRFKKYVFSQKKYKYRKEKDLR